MSPLSFMYPCHRVDRVLGFFSPVLRIGNPHPLTRRRLCSPFLFRERGWGSQFGRGDRLFWPQNCLSLLSGQFEDQQSLGFLEITNFVFYCIINGSEQTFLSSTKWFRTDFQTFFYLPWNGSERNSEFFHSAKQMEFRRNESKFCLFRLFRLPRNNFFLG